MRTKTFLLSAAVFAAGLAVSTAQSVYSVNAVGYVNKTIVAGYNLIANPLNGTNNNINTIIPTAPNGSVILKWDGAAQQFGQADTYLDGLGWVDASVQPSTTTLNPGEGIFFQNNSGASATLTFVGEVPQGSLTNRIGANFGFYSSIVPQSAGLTALGFPGQSGMTYNGWDTAGQTYAAAYTYIDGLGWVDPGVNPVDPVPAVGEGFLITNPGAAVNWTRTFSVN
jgi:hypothetical protein